MEERLAFPHPRSAKMDGRKKKRSTSLGGWFIIYL